MCARTCTGSSHAYSKHAHYMHADALLLDTRARSEGAELGTTSADLQLAQSRKLRDCLLCSKSA